MGGLRYRSVSWPPGRTTGDRLGDAIPRAYHDGWVVRIVDCPRPLRPREDEIRRDERKRGAFDAWSMIFFLLLIKIEYRRVESKRISY